MILCRRPLLKLIPRRWIDRERTILLRNKVPLTYRLNKGDIWSLREVWLFDAYRFPANIRPKLIVDLGANIGLASVWLATQYQPQQLIAVEAVQANADLARRNTDQVHVETVVVPAAIGPKDGSVRFIERAESNFGRADYTATGSTPMLCMNTILKRHAPGQRIGLMKIDIEGAEQELLSSGLEWLASVDAIIIELHPGLIDTAGVIATLQSHGFRYIPANSAFPDNMDSFIRDQPSV